MHRLLWRLSHAALRRVGQRHRTIFGHVKNLALDRKYLAQERNPVRHHSLDICSVGRRNPPWMAQDTSGKQRRFRHVLAWKLVTRIFCHEALIGLLYGTPRTAVHIFIVK